jgi:hypothetical protein
MTTVSVTIDYSNGSQKSFANIPWVEGLTILEALEAAKTIPPGMTVDYGSSRSGSVINLSLDGVPEESGLGEWSVWVNNRRGPESLGTTMSFGFHPESRAENEVQAGDHILAKLVALPAESG